MGQRAVVAGLGGAGMADLGDEPLVIAVFEEAGDSLPEFAGVAEAASILESAEI